jgi:branched-chain amino acid transport system permease protein
LIALGYNLTFGVLKVANLAFGALLMVGAFATSVAATAGWLPPLAIVAGIACAAVVGLLVHAVAVMPLGQVERIDSPRHVSVLVSTLGASIILEHVALLWFGAYPQRFLLADQMDLAGGEAVFAVNAGLAAVVVVALALFVARSKFGLRLRAITANRELAATIGMNVTRDQLACVMISSALAGLAGILVCLQYQIVSPTIGFLFGVKGLIALIIGRSMVGAACVAVLLGVSEALVTAYLSSGYRDFIVYGLLIVVLVASVRKRAGDLS